MYILIVYSDLEQTEIIFIGRFFKIKNIIEYTDNVLKYSTTNKQKKYKTYKDLFKIIKV